MINYAAVRAVTFDVDDTLVAHTAAARAALGSVGAPLDWGLWQRITDLYAARVIAGELPYDHMHARRTQAYLGALGEFVDDAQAEWIDTERKRALAELLHLFDDVLDCLDWLRASGLRVGAVTNASGAHQRVKLADLGIADAFDTVVVAGEVGCAKPDAAIFRHACRELDTPPSATVHIGDRLRCDALGAVEAGLHGVWLNRSGSPDGYPGIPELTGLAELPELLVCELGIDPAPRRFAPADRRWAAMV